VPATVSIRFGDVAGPDEEIRRLARWLRDEDELRGRVRIGNKPIQDGEMGGVVDMVLVTATTTTAPVLVQSLFEWLARRREVDKVVLSVESESGRKVDLECGSRADAEKLLEALKDV
jgi:hypothetical protein